jgi:uncharacterized protein YhbP (UPF0306 family)
MDQQKKKIRDFLKTQTLAVIATVDSKNSKPEAALVAFSETEDLELIFGTLNDTRKFANLQDNPLVAFVIGYEVITVQYEGTARMAEGNEADTYRQIHLLKNPKAKKYAYHEKERFFKVSPTWIRYTDFSGGPATVFEVVF